MGTNGRIVGYDLARAVAFFGMLPVNFWVMVENNNIDPGWLVSLMALIQGRSAATFVVLAGVGISLISRRAYLNPDAVIIRQNRYVILRRALFLSLVGLLNSLLWPSDILLFYAFYFAIGACLLSASDRRLWTFAVIPVVTFTVLMFMFDFDRGWDLEADSHLAFWAFVAKLRHIFFDGLYPVFPWVAFLIVGMWLGRQDLSNHTVRKKMLLAGIGGVTFAECISRLAFRLSAAKLNGLETDSLLMWIAIEPWDPMPLFLISASGTGLITIVFSTFLSQKWGTARWILIFVSFGQLSLTLYVAHILMGRLALEVLQLSKVQPHLFPIWATALFFLGALLFIHHWRKRHRRGPLEWLMRKFSGVCTGQTADGLGFFRGKTGPLKNPRTAIELR